FLSSQPMAGPYHGPPAGDKTPLVKSSPKKNKSRPTSKVAAKAAVKAAPVKAKAGAKVQGPAKAKATKPPPLPRWLAKPNETIAKQLKKRESAVKKGELTHRFAQIAALAKPGIDFSVTKAKPADVAGIVSRIGGEPDLPASLPWPRTNAGPLTFV